MGVCEKIRAGLDMRCGSYAKRYYQQAVIVNRSDVLNKNILTSTNAIDGSYLCRHRLLFDLDENKSGYRFSLNETAASIFGTSEKSVSEGIPQYAHSVNIVLLGITEQVKCILSQLDYGDYFCALQFYDGTIEIFGFEYGLTTGEYVYDPATTGGAVIKLTSLEESLEDELPFVYQSSIDGNEIIDFNNNFADHTLDLNGDFNDDFNNDFNNQ